MSIELVLIPVAIALTQTMGSKLEKKLQSNYHSYSITTTMKEEQVLQRALDYYGCTPQILGENGLQSEIGDIKILFKQNEEGTYEALFEQDIPIETAEEFIHHLQNEYAGIVQQETYQALLQRAQEKGFLLEHEEVSDTNSIILTFQVN